MRRRLVPTACALLLSLLGSVAPHVAAAVEDAKAPYVLIRRLQAQQEQLAHGSAAAQAAQLQLLAAMPATFLEAEPSVWREPRNARAAVLYLFSGGRPSVVRTILARSTMPRDIDVLLKGALAYAEGQDEIARGLLEPIDPRRLPAALGGHLALIEATLLAQTDKSKARKMLELARLLVPGTLVEEAALRRQAQLDDDPATLGSYIFLARQYIHRFQASIYAQNFKQHLAAAAIKYGADGDMAHLGMIATVVAELPLAEQRALYLSVSKAAIVQGRTEAVRFAAERAATIAKDSTHDNDRAQLYLNAAMIVSTDVAKGVAALETADRSRLSPADADLRDAALAVARSVTSPVADPASGGKAPGGEEASTVALLEQARTAIAAGDKLLADGAQ